MALLLAAQPAPTAPAPCSAAQYRQFDFWLGEWDVADANGKLQGTNRIERIEGGCAIQETWTSVEGITGRSLNAYRPRSGTWHQLWVSTRGTVLLQLEGRFDGSRMVMTGRSERPDGTTIDNRITWTPLPDGRVRQLWEQADAPNGWQVVFDGYYSRRTR